MYFNFSTLSGCESRVFLHYNYMNPLKKNREETTVGKHSSRLGESQPYSWLQHCQVMNSALTEKPQDILFFYRTKIQLLRRVEGLLRRVQLLRRVPGMCREIATGCYLNLFKKPST